MPSAGQPGDRETERRPRDRVAERSHVGEHAGRDSFPNELQHGRVEAHKKVYRAGQDKHAGGQQSVGGACGGRYRITKSIVTIPDACYRRGPYSFVVEFRLCETNKNLFHCMTKKRNRKKKTFVCIKQ